MKTSFRLPILIPKSNCPTPPPQKKLKIKRKEKKTFYSRIDCVAFSPQLGIVVGDNPKRWVLAQRGGCFSLGLTLSTVARFP